MEELVGRLINCLQLLLIFIEEYVEYIVCFCLFGCKFRNDYDDMFYQYTHQKRRIENLKITIEWNKQK